MAGVRANDLTRRKAMRGLAVTVVGGIGGLASDRLNAAPAGTRRDRLAALERWIAGEITGGRITGAAAEVSQDGVSLWQRGLGFADVARSRPVTRFTSFGLASVTKPFITATLATLCAEGKVDLDAPVSSYLPFKLPWRRAELDAVTLRQLGSHSSGLPSFFALAEVPYRPPSPATVVHAFGRLAYPPGALYEYSNLGYLLLGAVISHVAELTFEEAVRRHLLDPLGLVDTHFLSEAAARAPASLRYADDGTPLAPYTTATPASGELCSSVHDLSLFAARLMGVPGQGSNALPRAAQAAIFAPAFRSGDGFTSFGWMGATRGEDAVFVKNGGDPGVSARLTLLPCKRLSIAVVMNRSNDDFVAKVAEELAEVFATGWRPVREDLASPGFSCLSSISYHGLWRGTVANDGVSIPIDLRLASDGVSCRLDNRDWRPWKSSNLEAGMLTGRCQGTVRSAFGTGEDTLDFRLIDRGDRLAGRVLQRSATSSLPFVVDLKR